MPTTKSKPTRRSAVYGPTALERRWAEILKDWRRAGKTVREFCRQRGLRDSTFWFWKREIPDRGRRRRAKAYSQSSPVKFVPVRVVEKAGAPLPLEVMAGRRAVRIAGDFDPAVLRKLLAVLEESP
jgi:hypothetical protein